MGKTFTLLLSTSPYSYENTLTAVRIVESALGKGHTVNLIASGDGVYCFLRKQKAKGDSERRGGIFKADAKGAEGLSLRRMRAFSPCSERGLSGGNRNWLS